MDSETIAINSRLQVIEYCINHCDVSCCKKGMIPLQSLKEQQQMHDMMQIHHGIPVAVLPCTHLKEKRCTIYNNRPKICQEFPILIRGKMVFISPACRAVQQGKLDNSIKQFQQSGYTIV